MALFAAGLPISALGVVAKDLWSAIAFISIATACHQAWSANMFRWWRPTPSRAAPSARWYGFGGMCASRMPTWQVEEIEVPVDRG